MKINKSWYFLLAISLIYLALFCCNPAIFWSSFNFFIKTLIKIIPIFAFIFILMVLVNKYIDNDFIIKHLRGSKIKSWFYIIIGGIISTGPMYVWYPLLSDLRNKGISNGEVASFLYNRSIKPAFLPIIILYFGVTYTVVLSIVIILMSFVQALLVEFLMSFSLNKK
ncbi:MAG TPA: hypothetical protein ENJ75_03255 [Candidatus Kaiserbacteria bacterium]|nr:hypothetical protein [Candidatus Kaiserbacteria bacterium]